MIVVRLKELLDRRGIRTKPLADATGIGYVALLDLVARRTTRIDLSTLDRLCAHLNVKPGALLSWEPGAQPKRERRKLAAHADDDRHPADCQCYDCLWPRDAARIDRLVREEHRLSGGTSRWEDDRDG